MASIVSVEEARNISLIDLTCAKRAQSQALAKFNKLTQYLKEARMKQPQCGGMPVLMAGVLLGAGLAITAMLSRIRRTRVHSTPVVDQVPVTAGRLVNHVE